MGNLTADIASEKLSEQVLRIQEICQSEGLTIESVSSPVFVVIHYKDNYGVNDTIRQQLTTTPF